MIDVVYGFRKELSFDFIYGYMMGNGLIVSGDPWQNVQTCPQCRF